MSSDRGIDLLDTRPSDATGSHSVRQSSKLIQCPIGHFVVVVRVTEEDQFVGIEEIEINRRFFSPQQMSRMGSHDVDEYYRE